MIDNSDYIQMLMGKIENYEPLMLTVSGDSMLPTLQNGDQITIRKCKEYNIGDIIAYYIININIKIIIHRVIFVRKSYLLTKGDNNDFIDPIKVEYEHILGKVQIDE